MFLYVSVQLGDSYYRTEYGTASTSSHFGSTPASPKTSFYAANLQPRPGSHTLGLKPALGNHQQFHDRYQTVKTSPAFGGFHSREMFNSVSLQHPQPSAAIPPVQKNVVATPAVNEPALATEPAVVVDLPDYDENEIGLRSSGPVPAPSVAAEDNNVEEHLSSSQLLSFEVLDSVSPVKIVLKERPVAVGPPAILEPVPAVPDLGPVQRQFSDRIEDDLLLRAVPAVPNLVVEDFDI